MLCLSQLPSPGGYLCTKASERHISYSGSTWGDIERLVGENESVKAVKIHSCKHSSDASSISRFLCVFLLFLFCIFTCPSGSTLCKDLRLYLSKCFTPGSVDSQLQQVIRENLYLRAVPCESHCVKDTHLGFVFPQISGLKAALLSLKPIYFCQAHYD